MKKICILGVNGFIGHHLSKRILAKTDWEVFYGAQATGNPGDPNWQPISPIGTLLIRVYRVAGNPSCDQWTLTVSE